MQTTYMNIDNLQELNIGHRFDHQTSKVVIDCKSWLRKYPAITQIEVCVTLPNGMIFIPATAVNKDGELEWVITHNETGVPGEGSYQLIGTGKYGDRRTTEPAGLIIESNMRGIDSTKPPDPSEPWVNRVLAAARAADESAKEAAVSAETMLNPPTIGENGNWWTWDAHQAAYVDSGISARGAGVGAIDKIAREGVKKNAEEIEKLAENGGGTIDGVVTPDGKNAVSGAAVYTFVHDQIPDTIPADSITGGTFAGTVKANAAAAADLTTPQLRNSVVMTSDPGEGAALNYPIGTEINVV